MKVINYAFESYFDFSIQALNTVTGLRCDVSFKNLKRNQFIEIKRLIEECFWTGIEFSFEEINKIMEGEY